MRRVLMISCGVLAAALLASCQSAYYGAMEKFGYEKRDILINRVDDAREAQQQAKKQFESALEQFIAVTNFSGGDLDQQYNKLKSEYDDSEFRANTVRKRIAGVERVAQDLFSEWEKELTQYTSPELRRSSQSQLNTTRPRYRELIGAMKRAEKKLDPVLAAYHDRVLFLKHNLNARAIASLKAERANIQADITTLVADEPIDRRVRPLHQGHVSRQELSREPVMLAGPSASSPAGTRSLVPG